MIEYSNDPADWIIETHKRPTNLGDDWTVFRLQYWNASIKRYEFIAEEFWEINVRTRLRSFGVERPELVPVIDLDEAGISARNR